MAQAFVRMTQATLARAIFKYGRRRRTVRASPLRRALLERNGTKLELLKTRTFPFRESCGGANAAR
jgi:hypothetical protein